MIIVAKNNNSMYFKSSDIIILQINLRLRLRCTCELTRSTVMFLCVNIIYSCLYWKRHNNLFLEAKKLLSEKSWYPRKNRVWCYSFEKPVTDGGQTDRQTDRQTIKISPSLLRLLPSPLKREGVAISVNFFISRLSLSVCVCLCVCTMEVLYMNFI